MGFLDTIKSKLASNQDQGYDDSGYYGDGYYDDGQDAYDEPVYQEVPDRYASDQGEFGYSQGYSAAPRADAAAGSGVLGQTRRGEAESVAVYTRSGQLVGESDRHASTYNPPARPGAYDTPSSYAETLRTSPEPEPAVSSQTSARMSSVINATPQLPAYILRPESYDDVETVVRRVRTRQPVALVFVGVRTEVAKRVLDFSYGLACGLGGSVRELGDRVFMVLPQGCDVKESDLAKLASEGYLKADRR